MKLYKMLGILAVLVVVMALPAQAESGKPSVAIGDVSVTPAALMPGDKGTVTITLTNPLKSLTGDSSSTTNTYTYGGVDTQSHQLQTTVASNGIPDGAVYLRDVTLLADAPLRVTSKQFSDVGRLGMGDAAQFTFTIEADKNAANGIYQMTLRVRTDDSAVYLNYPIKVEITDMPLKVVLNDAPPTFSGSKHTVIMDIVNLRPNGVSGVSVIPSGSDFTFKPMQEYVVGSIGSGEMYTVQFDVTAKSTVYTGNPSFKVVFMNGNNWHETAPLTVYSDSGGAAAVAAANASNNNTVFYVAGLVVVLCAALGGIFLYAKGKRVRE